MKQINFRQWQFQCDIETTRSAYNQVLMGSADKCNCEDCRNYVLNIDKAFPLEILSLFEQMGIDYTKEAEVYSIGKPESGLLLYNGWLHFIGHMKGLDVFNNPNNISWDLTTISDTFKIGFTKHISLAHQSFDHQPLIQIEFFTEIPWTYK